MIYAAHLSEREARAVGLVLRYWETHWDWECPTLFGLGEAGFRCIKDAWPRLEGVPNADVAVVGALREFLFGPSAVPKDCVLAECGLSFVEASGLLQRIVADGERIGGDHEFSA